MADDLEQRVIRVATEYAETNGLRGDDRTAVGLVLAGMAIMASCSPAVRAEMLRAYLAQFPNALGSIRGWAAFIDMARTLSAQPDQREVAGGG